MKISRQTGMMSTRYLRCWLFLLLISFGAHAQEGQSFENLDGLPLEIELRLIHVTSDGSSRPVPADHVFADGDLFALELEATRGGYASLAVADADAEDGLRQLWPPGPGGHPVAARQPTRLPALGENPLQLQGQGPTELAVVFSPRPPEAKTKRRWLVQIDLRGEIDIAADAPEGPKPIRFTGRVRDDGVVKMKVVLQHGGGSGDG